MNVRKLDEGDIPQVCMHISSRLLDSVEGSFMVDGLEDKWGLITAYTASRMKHWQKVGEVWVLENNQGMLTGHYGRNEKMWNLILSGLSLNSIVSKALSKEDLKRLKYNLQKMSGAQNISWRKKACKRQEYYYIELITIDRSLKGSGAFRQLMEPIIARSQNEKMPVLLDTHDKNNVPIYQHFGFELVGEYHSKHDPDIAQYSMIKRPCEL